MAKKNYDLKSCPFCGGSAVLERSSRCFNRGKEDRAAYVRCTLCEARTGRVFLSEFGCSSSSGKAEDLAVASWNTRRVNKGRLLHDGHGWWECSECGSTIDWDSVDDNDPPPCNYCPSCGIRLMK